MDVEGIHQGLANAASTITGLIGLPAISGALPPSSGGVFAVVEVEGAYHKTFGATGGLSAPVHTCGLYCADTDEGRKLLNGYLAETGATSVRAAIEADRTLGGKCKTLIVMRFRGAYRVYEVADTPYLGAMLDVGVWA